MGRHGHGSVVLYTQGVFHLAKTGPFQGALIRIGHARPCSDPKDGKQTSQPRNDGGSASDRERNSGPGVEGVPESGARTGGPPWGQVRAGRERREEPGSRGVGGALSGGARVLEQPF
ncbi:hypothetical protein NDU88_000509 [Pleurodeles waltl]|uniref:Uncharacterized protein n=1 Tax=Pleurodeles waltl TaxID=8319 RepID=A0AAV7U4F5_PLEWA|nr:hypothetical protein NDU88_000509 [Pleurodeles waltl]